MDSSAVARRSSARADFSRAAAYLRLRFNIGVDFDGGLVRVAAVRLIIEPAT